MPENTVEILIRARDEATKTLNQAVGQVQAASQAAAQSQEALVRSSGQAERATVSFSRQVSGAAASARFLGFTVINELSPALGTGASRIASLASVATLGGNAMVALAAVGIGAAVIALTQFIQESQKAKEVQEQLNEAIQAGNDKFILKQIIETNKATAALQEKIIVIKQEEEALVDLLDAISGVSTAGTRQSDVERQLAELTEKRKQLERDLTAAIDQKTIAMLASRAAADELAGLEAIAEARTLALTDATRELAEVTERVNKARGGILLITAKETTGQAEAELKELTDSLRIAEEEAGKAAEFIGEQSAARIDKIFREVRERGDVFVNAMTSLGNAGADALFDGLIGRSRSLAETFRSFMEGLARDIFRNTLVQAFGGKTQGLNLQNLLSLGGARPGFSPAALGAMIPGGSGIPGPQTAGQVAASFGFTGGAVPAQAGLVGAEEAFRGASVAGTSAAGLTLLQGLGGILGIAGGGLAIAGTAGITSPPLGALVGGLGGLSVATGALTLFGTAATATAPAALFGLGSAALGAIGFGVGAVIGIGLSIAASQRAKKKRRSAAMASQNVQLGEQRIAELEALLGTPAAGGAFAEHPFLVELVLDVGRVMRFQSSNTDNARVAPFRFFLDSAVDVARRFVAGTASAIDVARTVHASFNRPDVDQFPMSATLSASGAIWIQRLLSQGVAGFLAAETLAFATGEGLPEGFEPPQAFGGFLIQEALAPGITRLEALADIGPRQRAQAIAALQRGALVQLINAAGPEEMELIIARIRETSELMGLPVLGQARFLEILG